MVVKPHNKQYNTIMEPFKIKTVEAINILSTAERRKELRRAGYNLFRVPADKVTIDLLTDSGTGALSEDQWSMLMKADESYAGAKSWYRFEKSVREFTGKRHIIPAHQGRACEKLIAELLLCPGDFAVSNTFFDTTRANFEHAGATCVDFPASDNISLPQKFKGNLHLKNTEFFLNKNKNARILIMTLTNNAGGGQPASLKNVRAAAGLAKKYGLVFIIDACRIAENGYFIKKLERLPVKTTVSKIIKMLLAPADITFMSAKKDGLANMGGFIATNNVNLADKLKNFGILYEGFSTYGGMSGREMETIAVGLKESIDENYLSYRVGQTAYLHKELSKIGFKLVNPAGGHAVYIDAEHCLPRIHKNLFPAQALAVAFYLEGGMRGVEIGSLMFGKEARRELMRLAIPRRVYTQLHLDHVIQTAKTVWKKRETLAGFKIVAAPKTLRHFSAILKPLGKI